MKRLLMAMVAVAGVASAYAADKDAPAWGYEGEKANWGKGFRTCGIGKAQAPLDIRAPFDAAKQVIKPDYKEGALKIVNNGHTIQVNVEPGSKLMVDTESYDLLQFHFHRPSEETLNGKPTAMNVHLVHRSASGKLAVIGVLLNEGKANAAIGTIWAAAPKKEGPEVTVPKARINAAGLLPAKLDYYTYAGSLTTPPCTEGVTFYILKTPVEMAKAQVNAFPFKMNARPVQPLHGRKIAASN